MNPKGRYLSYLLRLWQESAGDRPSGTAAEWRASLQDAQSDHIRLFAGPDELFAFLREQIELGPPAGGRAQGSRDRG